MSASRDQIDAALGQLTTHGRYFSDWSTPDLQYIVREPRKAIAEWRQTIIDRRRKMVIPTSNRTDEHASFVLDVGGRVDSLSLYQNTHLSNPEMLEFDYLSRHMILSDRVLDRSDFSVQEYRVSFKILTLNDFGFDDHVETGVFMNDEFLRAWSNKHYSGHTLSLCKDTDFLFFVINPELNFGEGVTVYPIFAMKPVIHYASDALFVFAVQARVCELKRTILSVAAHRERRHTLVQKFVFRITPNEPKTRSVRPKRK